MALVLTGLGHGDVAEVVECLFQCAGTATAPELSAYRRGLAGSISDALDALPAPRGDEDQGAAK
ncbi:hypothetical protein ACFRQM_09585 [Streptomyces sp. NPDC056831]|uniref:hypothetical protein n=1 Tax=Streptomyces sp. NPDC056831 TaxID=3345954 RepID=UPI0036B8E5E2